MNKAKILGVLASLGLGGLLTYGDAGLRSSVARGNRRDHRSLARKTAEQSAADSKAAGIKRLRRQQRNTLLAEKGAFLDSRLTYPNANTAWLAAGKSAVSKGSSVIKNLDPAGVQVIYGGKEIVAFG